MAPCWRPKFVHPCGCPPPKNREKACPRCGRTAVQNFTLIGKAPAEKSVTVHKKWKRHSKLSIPPYTAYGRIKIKKSRLDQYGPEHFEV